MSKATATPEPAGDVEVPGKKPRKVNKAPYVIEEIVRLGDLNGADTGDAAHDNTEVALFVSGDHDDTGAAKKWIRANMDKVKGKKLRIVAIKYAGTPEAIETKTVVRF